MAGADDGRGSPPELIFFERFQQVAQGLATAHELAAFHVAMKCGDVTLVAGSSERRRLALIDAYTAAIAGDSDRQTRSVTAAVEASWLDSRDVIGAVNPVRGTFDVAATGIFDLLHHAAAEYERNETDSGIYVLCLAGVDEASAEQYLAGLLTALERPDRALRLFDPRVVAAAPWLPANGVITLPPSLRIVGTLHEHEMSQPPGLMLRDASYELRMDDALRSMPELRPASIPGAPVTLQAYRRWVRSEPLPASLSALLESVQAALRPVSLVLPQAAVERIEAFVASAHELLPADTAFDLQLAARLRSRIHTLQLHGSSDQLVDAVAAALDDHPVAMPAVRQLLAELQPGSTPGFAY
jgi:hypothetical protein